MVFSGCIREIFSRPITEWFGYFSGTCALLIGLFSLCTRPDWKLYSIFFCSVIFMGVAVQKFRYFCEPLESAWKTNKSSKTFYTVIWFYSSMSLWSAKLTYLPVLAHFFKYLKGAYRHDESRLFLKVHSDNGERQWTPVAIWENPSRYKEIFSPWAWPNTGTSYFQDLSKYQTFFPFSERRMQEHSFRFHSSP